VNKAARITKAKSSEDHQNKDYKIFQSFQKVEEPNPPFLQLWGQ